MSRARRGARDERHASDPSGYWDDVARARGGAPLWRLHADRATRALLARWLPSGRVARVLKTDLYDEACTDGLVPELAAHADGVFGIDVSPVVAASAGARARVLAVAGDVRLLPFRSGSFDVVVSNSTLDHFAEHAEIGRALAEIERVLAPDGVLILTLDNARHPMVRVRNALAPLLARAGILPYAVGATHGPRGLRAALDSSGFALLELTAVHHFPRLLLVAIERLARGRGGAAALRLACSAEALERLPTRWWTGQYVAALVQPRRDREAGRALARGAA
jgi:SAM-dependent methyltransferase